MQMSKDIQKFLGNKDITIVEAMRRIDENAKGIIYIVDENNCLIGALSDGDIRRWIIKTGDLKSPISNAMNDYVSYVMNNCVYEAMNIMNEKKITSVPVVDSRKKVVDIVFLNGDNIANCSSDALVHVPVIVMAGGKGTRLYPYTKILPKPLIPIGEIPILERILNRFHDFGANKFYLTVNYKKEMIRSYFNELKPNYAIEYVEEDTPLGTAGSIRLIQKKFDAPVIVTNCDILIQADYGKILDYHKESKNDMTIVSSLKNITIPYGVITAEEQGRVVTMEEKPTMSHFINTGMYIVNPEHLDKIPNNTVFHMTHLAEKLLEEKMQVGMYPISENSYLDMGQFEEMKRMEEHLNLS